MRTRISKEVKKMADLLDRYKNMTKELSIILYLGMFKNNEAFHFMASYAHFCLDFKDQT